MIHTHLGSVRMYDGGSCLYLPKRLEKPKMEYSCVHPHDNSEFVMIVTFIKQKKLGECLHLFNVLFKKIMRALLYSQIGRNYFDPHHTHMIPQHRLEVLPGYAVAVDEYEGGVMICLDTQHRVMRTQNVYDVLIDLQSMAKERVKENAGKALLGTTVLTRYNNKNYRIDDILWNNNPEQTFQAHDGREISYVQYYKTQYGIDIKDTKQPLLLNRQSKKVSGSAEKVDRMICLIPELCYLTGLTDEMRSDFKVMKDVAMYTRVTPNQRMCALKNYLNNIEKTPKAKEVLNDWGLKLENATVDLLARVLDPETILFGNGVRSQLDKADWNAAITKNAVLSPVDLKSWYVFYTARDEKYATDFAQTMTRIGNPMGMSIDKPRMYKMRDDRTETYLNTLRNMSFEDVQILVFICPTSRDDRYSAIKRFSCSETAIPTQVINSRTLSNPQKVRSIIQKIALQMNCKLGGSLWSVPIPVTKWMVCGIDVYHSPSSKQSVCAFVSSLNDNMTRWYSTAIFQDQELGDYLKMAFAKSLEKFREINGNFPTTIVVFRDGVGDGQLKQCQQHEVAQFERCLKDYHLDSKIVVVVVQKRINTRLFMVKGRDLDNPLPGTIIDNKITRHNWYDFFLVAQQVRQGTVTPTHYVVVHDSGKLKPDHVQRLAFKLCHLYYNWPGTIRVPAPCQYAHKLAYLVGQHIRKEPSAALCDRLFYL
ncbi:hypothetical protein ILUMI_25545 [Ignelater luminosus]|uniref:Uncharacterized protein n=1 Tax=Ignelater luminosus TaxID=2038154 RepID=A0A8K0C884_IGNLU|nr:hypothetical protein ILUMI_25545 [Ignelater luminosus]